MVMREAAATTLGYAGLRERRFLMQAMKYGIFLVLGLALQACGDDSDGGGDGGGDDNGGGASGSGSGGTSGTGATGGSTSNGGSSGAGTTGGSTGTGGSSGAGTTGGSTGTGGAAGAGGACTGGQVNLFDTPECEDFFNCIFDSACADAGAQQQFCIDLLKQAFSMSVAACAPAGEAAAACEMAKADPQVMAQYPECVD